MKNLLKKYPRRINLSTQIDAAHIRLDVVDQRINLDVLSGSIQSMNQFQATMLAEHLMDAVKSIIEANQVADKVAEWRDS